MAVVLDPNLKRIGRALQGRDADFVDEQLPKRWVELILRLNELERDNDTAPDDPHPSRH
jgi:hypothetical protein